MTDRPPLTESEIRRYYADAIRESGDDQMNYPEFYEWLRARGIKSKGSWRKEQQRSIYNAVTGRKDFVKVAPGVFALSPPEGTSSD